MNPPPPSPTRVARDRPTSFWAERERKIVTIHDPARDPSAWEQYVAGLQACYELLGVGHIVTDDVLAEQECISFWLIRDEQGEVIGGARAVGLARNADEIEMFPAVHDIGPEANREVLRAYLVPRAADGMTELKGAWSAEGVRGLGSLSIRRLGWHTAWWHGLGHTIGTQTVDVHDIHQQHAGYQWVPGVEPVDGFPAPQYRTIPVIYSVDTLEGRSDELTAILQRERAYLGWARNRALGRPDIGVELALDLDELSPVMPDGTRLNDQTVPLLQEAIDCRSTPGSASTSGTTGSPSPEPGLPGDGPHPWVYYPWRNSAVRIVRPGSFHGVRTDRNRNKITSEELARLRTKKIGVVGLSVGAAIAFALAQEGLCGELRLADFDRLELTNMNRLSASLLDLGEPKTHLAARRIAELDPYLDLHLYDEGLDRSNVAEFLSGLDLVFEECDSLDIKLIVREEAARLGVPVVMESNDRGMLDVERYDLDPTLQPFHGLIGDTTADELAGLATEDKVVHILDIMEVDRLSSVLGASMVEIDETLTNTPQLASDVHLGAALAVHAARSILLDRSTLSGRVRVDLDQCLASLSLPDRPTRPPAPPVVRTRALPDHFEEAIVRAAELAPSGGNMQPWRFSLTSDHFVVEQHGEPVGMDIGGRGTAVACGAALFNAACVAAANHRLGSPADPFDLDLDLDRPQVMGRVVLGHHTDPALASLVPLIPNRVTNRQLDLSGRSLSSELLADLTTATRTITGAALHHIPPGEIDGMVEAWSESDRLRFVTPRLHADIFNEVRRPGVDDVARGLDERTLELDEADRRKLDLLRRPDVVAHLDDWDAGHRLSEDGITSLRQSAGALVVTVVGRDRASYLRGGMALQRMWLEATRLGLGLQPVSPVFGYANDVADLTDLLGEDRGTNLFELQARFRNRFGFADDESFVLALRVHFGPSPSALSDRAWAELPSAQEVDQR